MPHSLKSKVKSLCYKGEITEKERDRIIKALEQQPSEDAISREALTQKLNAWDSKAHGIPNYAWKVIRELPSVTPERPKGKWIDIRVIKSFHYDGEPRVGCSRCGNEEEWSSNYCPNCGADMSGGEEDV